MESQSDGCLGLFVALCILCLIMTGCDACMCITPQKAREETSSWLKVGDVLVNRDWRDDTIIILQYNQDKSEVRYKKLSDGRIGQEEPLDLYNWGNYVNINNPNFKLSKPVSF